jgi:hypothetical protein
LVPGPTTVELTPAMPSHLVRRSRELIVLLASVCLFVVG